MPESTRDLSLLASAAHELNNPATAVQRGAAQLADALERYAARERRLGRAGLADDPRLPALAGRVRAVVRSPRRIHGLDRSDAEAELESWLEGRGVAEPWELAPGLVELGCDPPELSTLADELGDAVVTVLEWLVALQEVRALLAEIEQGSNRVREIVTDLRAHAYHDRAPVRAVDIHEGLENTLRILRTKLEAGTQVRREFAADLPRVQGHGSELSQVWTNLIDNAIYATDGNGTVTLRTRAGGDWVEVEVEDDGPGIAEEVRPRIFDPFFTTKPPGQGTGLGLDISYDIVVNRHRGDLSVRSEPGRTVFTVRLPTDLR